MRYRAFLIFLCVAHAVGLGAEPFQEAEVTEKINLVSLLLGRESRPVVLGDIVKGDRALKTGGDSRAELQFTDLTITRVGSNALFRFLAGKREITLDSGTLLFSSPEGAGGGNSQVAIPSAATAGAATAFFSTGHHLHPRPHLRPHPRLLPHPRLRLPPRRYRLLPQRRLRLQRHSRPFIDHRRLRRRMGRAFVR
jgi:hypothetical protein